MRGPPRPPTTETRTTTDSTACPDRATFAALGLAPGLLGVLGELGYEEPTPIQREAIPPLLEGRDLLGNAATGTGKTAAFALPLLQRIADGGARTAPGALVLVPTRELAVQVSDAVLRYGRGLGARVVAVFGGQPIGRQLRALHGSVDVVVATPGRALDHLRRGSLRLDALTTLVLDEADEMLDMGFADDLDAILAATPEDRQTVLFSATLPARIATIARRHLRDPVRIRIGTEEPLPGEAPRVTEAVHYVRRADKPAALARILDVEAPTAAIVFCRTRTEVEELAELLNRRGHRAEALHGGVAQDQRDRVMARLRSRAADLVVATDVAARGLDIDHLTHVVNYDVPSAPESYVHRIGRVGRAGREGVAIMLAESREGRQVANIERVTGRRIPVRPVPGPSELRARRVDALRDLLRDALGTEAPAEDRELIEALAAEADPVRVALAALRVARDARWGAEDQAEIAEAGPRSPRTVHGRAGGAAPHGRSTRSRGAVASGPTARLFIGAGRQAGVRPQDLVGAVAGESTLSGRDVGAIEIFDRFSLVEVPAAAADEVIAALRGATIRGRNVPVRHGRDDGDRPPRRAPREAAGRR